MNKLTYREGDVFAVPLRNGGFSLGVVARSPKLGKVLLGYFFRQTYPTVPKPADLPPLVPQSAIKVIKFGDLSLMNGEWPVVGRVQNWDQHLWRMPKFVWRSSFTREAKLMSYAEDDPNLVISEEPCEFDDSEHEEDSVWGAGYVEIFLTRLLASDHGR